MKLEDKPFIFWDGEATVDAGYCLFGCGDIDYSPIAIICKPQLSSEECLDLILKVEEENKDAIHVSFSFGYDVNNIIKDLNMQCLILLKELGKCRWKGYTLEYIPRKWFRVSRKGISAQIFDTFLFFNCKFGKALRKYGIGDPESLDRIDSGKEERPRFTWANIEEIKNYWCTELVLGANLLSNLREILYKAGFRIRSWHGPGALASYALENNGTKKHMDHSIDVDVRTASQYAMFGGRFQPFQAGYYIGDVIVPDINSAYAYAFSRLPSLAKGKWIHQFDPDPSECRTRRLGLYRIRYLRKYNTVAMPLPHRDNRGNVSYPSATIGWHHASEAALVSKDSNAIFEEAWVYEDDGTYPFNWIMEAFQKRLDLQRANDPTEKGLKWMLAALYGQAAQRAGWKKSGRAPKWHQLEWAGAVTAECRAMLYSGMKMAGKDIVSADTDGFISLKPISHLPNGIGENLGQWKVTTYGGILYLQNGIYWLLDKKSGDWEEPKSRGIPRKKLDIQEVLPLIRENKNLEFSQHMFIGFGLAMSQNMAKWRTWQDIPRKVTFGGNGKACHKAEICDACQRGESYGSAMHRLVPIPPRTIESSPYKLPWITNAIPDRASLMKEWGIPDGFT